MLFLVSEVDSRNFLNVFVLDNLLKLFLIGVFGNLLGFYIKFFRVVKS